MYAILFILNWIVLVSQKFKISYCLVDIRAVLAGQSSDTKQEDNLNLTEVACPVVVRVNHPGAHLDHLTVHYV